MQKLELRSYIKIAQIIKDDLIKHSISVGEKLPPERTLAERFKVSRTLVREALIMLEIQGLVHIKKGSGVYLLKMPCELDINTDSQYENIGPFEMLQARQLVESGIAEFATLQVKPNDIQSLREILLLEKQRIEAGGQDDFEDEKFHLKIAEITQNNVLIQLQKELWRYRQNKMWEGLHSHISNSKYRKLWLADHEKILCALQRKDPILAKKAVWQHLENVKEKLFELSDIESSEFDGFLYQQSPVLVSE